jgi:Cu(I)/Ag(I) efflux system membrane protein CusA/SilA
MRLEPFRFRPRWLSALLTRVVVSKSEQEEKTWINRALMAVYHPALLFTLRHRWLTIAAALLVMALTVTVFPSLGSEFMPPLNEGTILYMPITLPGISVTEATKYLQIQDKLLRSFPEVESVFGKVGKADTSTDPAPSACWRRRSC